MYKPDMIYNGTSLDWHGHGLFHATSGLTQYQNSSQQAHADGGPIPEGLYSFRATLAGEGTMIGAGQLDRREGIERLPREFHYGGKDYQNQAWGPDRVRLAAVHIDDPRNRHRAGFYLHDSTKGYSHGCIEVEQNFFLKLRSFAGLPAAKRGGRTVLYLKVKYPSGNAGTYGGTRVP